MQPLKRLVSRIFGLSGGPALVDARLHVAIDEDVLEQRLAAVVCISIEHLEYVVADVLGDTQ